MPQVTFRDFGAMQCPCPTCGKPLRLVEYLLGDEKSWTEMMWVVGCFNCRTARCLTLEDSDQQDHLKKQRRVVRMCGSKAMKWQETHYNLEPEAVDMQLGREEQCRTCGVSSRVLVEDRRGNPLFYRWCLCGSRNLEGEELEQARQRYEQLCELSQAVQQITLPWQLPQH